MILLLPVDVFRVHHEHRRISRHFIRKTVAHVIEYCGGAFLRNRMKSHGLHVLVAWLLRSCCQHLAILPCAARFKFCVRGPMRIFAMRCEIGKLVERSHDLAENVRAVDVGASREIARTVCKDDVVLIRAGDLISESAHDATSAIEYANLRVTMESIGRPAFITYGGPTLPFKPKETEVTHQLVAAKGGWVSAADLLWRVWGQRGGSEGKVRSTMLGVRRALRPITTLIIETQPRVGWALKTVGAETDTLALGVVERDHGVAQAITRSLHVLAPVFFCATIAEARVLIRERKLAALFVGLQGDAPGDELVPLALAHGALVMVLIGDGIEKARATALKTAGAAVRRNSVAVKVVVSFAEAALQAAKINCTLAGAMRTDSWNRSAR